MLAVTVRTARIGGAPDHIGEALRDFNDIARVLRRAVPRGLGMGGQARKLSGVAFPLPHLIAKAVCLIRPHLHILAPGAVILRFGRNLCHGLKSPRRYRPHYTTPAP